MICRICRKKQADLTHHWEIHHIPFMYFLITQDPAHIDICHSCHAKIHRQFRKEFGLMAEDMEELIEKTLNGRLKLNDLLLIERLVDWQYKLKDKPLGDYIFQIERYAKR